ncbi:unnamed protein product [Adineta steineri]|uniref:Twitchin n=1 Tax=Adineta steineri TaxID=433720 RepID=A0A813NAX2_9BILA|nr:unnamed protein product [Adineta steineri]CAF1541151.1 unnamed protein product [Adineta steineri]CAF1541408.1 unnamed protein product [Adineta steineri]
MGEGGSNIERYIVKNQDLGRDTCAPAGEVNIDSTSLRVTKLAPGKKYLFRVRAVNKEGEGEPLKTTTTTLAKIHTMNQDKDGGASVEKYIIEHQEKGFDNNATITDLLENSEVAFCVKAVNKAGESEPSSTTDGRAPTFVKKSRDTIPEVKWCRNGLELSPSGRCRIATKLNELKSTLIFNEAWDSVPAKLTREPEEQRIPLGETLKVKIPISADDDRVRIQEFDDFIVVTIPDTEREDAGKYAINVANDSGSCNVPLKFFFTITPPLPPTGPLEISNVSKDRATLSWKPPKDDGGSKVTDYVIERQPPGSLGQPDITGMTNNTVTLNWEKVTSDDGGPITGYWIEKREENTDKGISVNKSPCQSAHFTVPSLVEDHIYEFRVTAENEADKETPSDATKPTKVKDPNASTPPEFVKKLKDAEGNEGKTITLECEVIGTPKPDFKGTKEISQGAKHTITRDGDKCVLVINNATPDDVDEYSIKVRNRCGLRMYRCNVNVRSPRRFRLPPKYQDVLNYDKGEPIVIKIPYTDNPLPNVMLSKDGNDIMRDKNGSIDVSNRAITLTIRNGDKNTTGCQPERATLKHGGVYDYYDTVEEIGQ